MFSYLGVVTLLYTEFPANFTPLYGIYGIAIGSATHRLASFLRARMPAVVAGALAAMLLVPFAWNTAQTMGSMSEIAFVTNSHAERDITRYLVDHPAPRSVPVTINLLAGGVVDALSGDTIHSIQAEEWLGPCERREAKDHLPDCLYDRFRAVLRTEAAAGAFRLILPVNYDLVHRPPELLTAQHTQFERAAHDEGLVFRLEQTFSTPKGTPAAQLFWIGPQGS